MNTKRRDYLVNEVASLSHDLWRAPRKIHDTNRYKSSLKKVRDEKWILSHNGQTEVDIANTAYADLPDEWQAENKASSEIAVDEVLKAAENGVAFDKAFIEIVASVIHDAWVKRNASYAPAELKKPYAELPEVEKEKDRLFVLLAIRL